MSRFLEARCSRTLLAVLAGWAFMFALADRAEASGCHLRERPVVGLSFDRPDALGAGDFSAQSVRASDEVALSIEPPACPSDVPARVSTLATGSMAWPGSDPLIPPTADAFGSVPADHLSTPRESEPPDPPPRSAADPAS